MVLLAPSWAGAQAPLFSPPETGFAAPAVEPLPDIVLRARTAELNADVLPGPEEDLGQEVLVNLFSDTELSVELDQVTIRQEHSYTWRGNIAGDPLGTVTLSVLGDIVQGTVQSPKFGAYQIRNLGGATHEIQEMDQSAFPPCGTTGQHAPAGANSSGPAAQATPANGDETPIIDVMVVYTPRASILTGGSDAMEALINLAIDESNDAYTHSGANLQIRLVHHQQVAYTEGMGEQFTPALYAITNPYDNKMDNVHELRDIYGADAVVLLINDTSYCGLGWSWQQGDNFAMNAFSVTSTACATGYYSFAHELGHNMGLQHDFENADVAREAARYPYAFGWRWNNDSLRSIMAYAPGTRVQRFSNPNILYAGTPTGVVDLADNARVLTNTAPLFSTWREHAGDLQVTPLTDTSFLRALTGALTPSSTDYSVINLNAATNLSWTVASSQPWLDVSPTSGTTPVNGSTPLSVTLNTYAGSLAPGHYAADLTFTNTADASTKVRTIQVHVAAPPPTLQYFVSMDTDPGWTATGNWQYGVPQGQAGDPTTGYTGSKVYGYNLAGAYENLMPQTALTTQAFDCSRLTNVHMSFYRWLTVESSVVDNASFQVSRDGVQWVTIFGNGSGNMIDRQWTKQEYNLSSIADGTPTLYIRFIMGSSDDVNTFGGWNIDDFAILGYSGGGELALTNPNGGEAWVSGSFAPIDWHSYSWSGEEVKFKLFKGGDFVRFMGGIRPNRRSLTYPVPVDLAPGDDYRVMIYTPNYRYQDLSDAAFSIVPSPLQLSAPNGGEVWTQGSFRRITWLPGVEQETVKFKLYKDGVLLRWIGGVQPNDGAFIWNVPGDLPAGPGYALEVYTPDYAYRDRGNATFSLQDKLLHLLSPNGGESLRRGTVKTITWNFASGSGEGIKFKLYKGGVFQRFLGGEMPNNGTWNWTIPGNLPLGNDYTLKIYTPDYAVEDVSDGVFSIIR